MPARPVVPAAPGLTLGGRRVVLMSKRKCTVCSRASCPLPSLELRLYKLIAPPAAGSGEGRWENWRNRQKPPARPPAPQLVALAGQLLGDEFPKALEVLAVEFNVIVPGPIHPQRLHSLGAAFEKRQAMGKVDDFILRAVDDEDRRGDFGDLFDAAKKVGGKEMREGGKYRDQGTPIPPAPQNTFPWGEGPGNAL